MEVPPVACVPNFLVQQYALKRFRLQTGGTVAVRLSNILFIRQYVIEIECNESLRFYFFKVVYTDLQAQK